MKYQHLLFSCSLNRDYRWMLTPNFLQPQDFRRLEELVWSDDIRRYFRPASTFWPFTLMRMGDAHVLCRFRRTEYLDADKRPIDCIDGVVVQKADAGLLRSHAATLLTEQSDVLNSWQGREFTACDTLLRSVPETQVCTFSEDETSELKMPSGQNLKTLIAKEKFTFSEGGFEKITRLLAIQVKSQFPEYVQIAFGVAPDKVGLFQGFDLVVPFLHNV